MQFLNLFRSAEIRKIQEQRVGVEKDIQYFKEEQRKKKLKELEEKKRVSPCSS